MIKHFWLIVYYGFARFLPVSYTPIVGPFARWMRYQCGRRLFKKCGNNVNIERKAYFGNGSDIEIGNNSGIGLNSTIPHNTIIGENVMMGPNCYILSVNHQFSRIDIPMIRQGVTSIMQTVIEDDVWIGRDVLMMPGKVVKKGSIIGGG